MADLSPEQENARDRLLAYVKRYNDSIGVYCEATPAETHCGCLLCDVNFLAAQKAADGNVQLTKRELRCLELMARGFETKHIAVEMDISTTTVNDYFKNLYRKFDTSSRAGTVFKASILGLLQHLDITSIRKHKDRVPKPFPKKKKKNEERIIFVDDVPMIPYENVRCCSTGWTPGPNSKPIWTKLIPKDGWMICPECKGSYGAAPTEATAS